MIIIKLFFTKGQRTQECDLLEHHAGVSPMMQDGSNNVPFFSSEEPRCVIAEADGI